MLRMYKRKIKSIIADTIAYTLIAIITATILLICLKIASLVVTILTYESVKNVMLFMSFEVILIMLYREFREE